VTSAGNPFEPVENFLTESFAEIIHDAENSGNFVWGKDLVI
jgi:hypothetical protein